VGKTGLEETSLAKSEGDVRPKKQQYRRIKRQKGELRVTGDKLKGEMRGTRENANELNPKRTS